MAAGYPLFEVQRIFLEPRVETYQRGQEILARYPDAGRVYVASHWNIPLLQAMKVTPRIG
jgi:spore photoproduct lyase